MSTLLSSSCRGKRQRTYPERAKLGGIFLYTILFGIITGCGREESSPYDQNNKVFTLKSENGGENHSPPETPKETNVPVPEQDEQVQDTPEEGVTISPDKIVFHAEFQGGMQYDSMRIFTMVFGYPWEYEPENLPFPASSYVPLNFLRELSEIKITLEAKQNYGTERDSQTTQNIDFPLIELVERSSDPKVKNLFPNGDTFSGETVAHGIKLGCPSGFGCVERTDVRPRQEAIQPFSYCYFDEFDQPTFIVSGVSPAASEGLFSQDEVEFGPYKTVKVGIDEPCSRADIEKASKPFKSSFRKTFDTHGYFSRLIDRFTYGVEVKVFFINEKGNRIASEVQPYVDNTIGMQSTTVYYIDEKNNRFSKVMKRFFMPVMTSPLAVGMKVDGVFSFCQDKRNEDSQSLCL
jgi:hypothetical protein